MLSVPPCFKRTLGSFSSPGTDPFPKIVASPHLIALKSLTALPLTPEHLAAKLGARQAGLNQPEGSDRERAELADFHRHGEEAKTIVGQVVQQGQVLDDRDRVA